MISTNEQKEIVLKLSQILLLAPVDEIIPWSSLRKIDNVEIPGWMIQRARELLNKEYGMVFATVRGEGLRRLTSSIGVKYVGERSLLGIRKAARRGSRRLGNAVRFSNDITPSARRLANSQQCALNLMEYISMAKTVATLPDEAPTKPDDGLSKLKEALGL